MAEKRVIAKRYELGKLAGSGGMAEIYQAHDSVTGNKVAIKILNTELAQNEKVVELFRKEAEAAATLKHPHIIQVLASGDDVQTDGSGNQTHVPYIVMEYIDGLELSKVIARGPLKVSEAVRVAGELLSAVQFAHDSGIIHRDIKPANIMITRTGDVKVLDFGIARAVSETFEDLAQTTSILGTAAYFSPEQAQGQKVDTRTDIYAIGIVLFEMLTGKPPFHGDTAVAVAHQHIHAQPVAPSSLNSKVSASLDAVVLKALAKKKNLRFQKTQTFAAALEEAAKDTAPAKQAAAAATVVAVEEVAGAISEPAVEYTPSTELPDDLTYLFGTDPSTAPVLVQPEEFKPERKRIVTLVAIIALVSLVLTGIGVWVATLQPVNIFPSSAITMPDLKGETSASAKKDLSNLGLYPSIVEEPSGTVAKNKVIRTDPPKGTELEAGTPVTIYVSQGKVKTEIPNVVDLTTEEATAQLEEAGFVVGEVTSGHSAVITEGRIISTDPASGTSVLQGSKIKLSVSDGKIEIPELRGKTVAEASALLATMQLTPTVKAEAGCAKSSTPTVVSQSVSPGLVPQGTEITLVYCSG